ncbi:YDG/SRA domain-containing protein [Streptomyces sp. NPDC049585]|uniref:YDG/SRA domain-containing protein n=1 Tax=Streptomyces sp. NPDC049585 TaxID=3155154 RepID=UPI003434F419
MPEDEAKAVRKLFERVGQTTGLEDQLRTFLVATPEERQQAIARLLAEHFPADPWQEVLLSVGLVDEEFNGFGHPPYVPVGTCFESRAALRASGLHDHLQAGIWGKADEDAKSIVVSGGYEDDRDYGDVIIYTGQGGQQKRRQVRDQELTLGNAALVNSQSSGTPVRVIRGYKGDKVYSPERGYRYDGLYRVEDHWSQRGQSGFLVWQYRLVAVDAAGVKEADIRAAHNAAKFGRPTLDEPLPTGLPTGNDAPGRRVTTTQRVVRSTAVANIVKRMYDYTCQVCGIRIETPTGAYSEAAHIRPLGRPHNGPDTPENVLCLCPNHHVAFDFGMLTIAPDGTVVEHGSQQRTYKLRLHPQHAIAAEHLAYHREHHEARRAAPVEG